MLAAQVSRPRLLPLRPAEPPFDDHGWDTQRDPVHTQPPLPLAFPARSVRPVNLYSPLRYLGNRTEPETDLDLAPAWRATPRDELCDPVPWARQLARGVAEVLVGARPPRQLAAWLTEPANTDLRRAAWRRRLHDRRSSSRSNRSSAMTRERGTRILVRSVHVTEPADSVAEISAHLWINGRGTAVALRAEGRGGRWVCTAVDMG
jgi:Family of unknown function (DUF6459)